MANPVNPLDVNGDAAVSPVDVLTIINDLNRHGARTLPTVREGATMIDPDVNGDYQVSPMDVLQVVNHLNAGPRGSGEGASTVVDSGHELGATAARIAALSAQVVTDHPEVTNRPTGDATTPIQANSVDGTNVGSDVDRPRRAPTSDSHDSLRRYSNRIAPDHTEDVILDIVEDVALAWLSRCR